MLRPMQETGSSRFPRPTPVVKAMLIVFVASYVLLALLMHTEWGRDSYALLWFNPREILAGHQIWTFLTSALVHDPESSTHLIFNCIGLYFFAPALEDQWGSRRFAAFALITQVSGMAVVLLSAVLGLGGPVLGASAIVMGTVIAWGITYPDRQMLLFMVLPMRGVHLVYASVAFEILNAISFSKVSASAHFGGMAAGAVFALAMSGRLRRLWLGHRLKRLQAEAASLKAPGQRRGGPPLRVIPGGADKPPKDKKYLN